MRGTLRLAGQFVARPAVAAALLSLAEHTTVAFVDSAIIRLKKWEREIRRFDEVITIKD